MMKAAMITHSTLDGYFPNQLSDDGVYWKEPMLHAESFDTIEPCNPFNDNTAEHRLRDSSLQDIPAFANSLIF